MFHGRNEHPRAPRRTIPRPRAFLPARAFRSPLFLLFFSVLRRMCAADNRPVVALRAAGSEIDLFRLGPDELCDLVPRGVHAADRLAAEGMGRIGVPENLRIIGTHFFKYFLIERRRRRMVEIYPFFRIAHGFTSPSVLRPMIRCGEKFPATFLRRPPLPVITVNSIISISPFVCFVNRLFPSAKNIFPLAPSLPRSYTISSKIFQKIFQNPLEKYSRMYYNGCSYHFLITKIKIQNRGGHFT